MITIDIRNANKVNGKWGLFITFPYNQTIVDIIKSMPTRYWDIESKSWEVPFNKLEVLVSKLADFEIDIKADTAEMFKPAEAIAVPTAFEFKTKPFNHQIDGFQYGLEHDAWLLGDEQGLGKTKQVIDIAVAKKFQKGYKHCLIICGVNGLKWNWQTEIETHSNETGYILGQRMQKNGKLKIGSSADKLADLKAIKSISSYFLITNVESLRDKEFAAKLAKLCDSKEIGLVAIDEVHKCFDYDTEIETNLGKLKIGDIVTQKIQCDVLSYNEKLKRYEYKPILNHFENVVADNLLELELECSDGIHTIKCTKDHKFYTHNRGWVEAQQLTEDDDIAELQIL